MYKLALHAAQNTHYTVYIDVVVTENYKTMHSRNMCWEMFYRSMLGVPPDKQLID